MSQVLGKWVTDGSIVAAKLATNAVETLKINAQAVTAAKLGADIDGNGLTGGAGSALVVQADGGTLTVGASGVKVSDAGITETQLATSIAGAGLTGGAGSSLDVVGNATGAITVNANDIAISVDDSTIEVTGTTPGSLNVKAAGITETELNTSVAGGGLTGGGGAVLAVGSSTSMTVNANDIALKVDAVGAANIAESINVDATNGVGIKVDDSTIDANGSDQLSIVANGITSTHIDETDGYTWTGAHDFTGGTITVPAPASGTDAVTKTYVDALSAGIAPKDSAVAATDAVLADAYTYDNGTAGVGATLTRTGLGAFPAQDGVTLVVDERVLIKDETGGNDPYNGIYTLTTVGSGAASWVLTRATDNDESGEFPGANLFIEEGTANGDKKFVCTTNDPVTVGTTSISFSVYSSLESLTAGTGVHKSGSEIRIGATGATGDVNGINRSADDIALAFYTLQMEISANQLKIKAGGISPTELKTDAVETLKIKDDAVNEDKIADAAVRYNHLLQNSGTGLKDDGATRTKVKTSESGLSGTAVNVIRVGDPNGLYIQVDNSTIQENGSYQLIVKDAGITETQINSSSRATNGGLAGGSGSKLALDVTDLTSEATINDADEIAIYDASAVGHRRMTKANFVAGLSGETITQEAYTIIAADTTAGYFTLGSTPENAQSVRATPQGGPMQMNKQVSATAPDFDILSTNQFHFNNNGAAVGLSADMTTGDVIILEYAT